MSPWTRLAVCALTGCALVLVGCPTSLEPELILTPAPRTIAADGQQTTIRVQAFDEAGKAGSGTVTFGAEVGSFDATSVTLDADGTGTVQFSCSAAGNAACKGALTVTANWSTAKGATVTATAKVNIAALIVDAGTGGGGGGPTGGGGGADAGTGGGTPMGGGGGGTSMSDAGLSVAAERAALFIGTDDAVKLTATLARFSPAQGQDITFTTTAGLLRAQADGGTALSVTVPTDVDGHATAELVEDVAQTAATATITASHANSSAMGTTSVELLTLRQVSHQSTRCGAVSNCTLMGVKGSGYQETAQVTFRVTDALGRPAVGAKVQFSLNTAPDDVVLEKANGVTNSAGDATVSVQSGAKLGVFSVQAVVIPGQVEGSSPTLAIRGAKPANKQFRLFCASVNVPAYNSPNPPQSLTVACTVRVVDRNNNPVGTGLAVSLKTEAGNVPNSANTAAFMNNNPDEGIGTFNFSTVGGIWPPVDTTPFVADSSQFPYPRYDEPHRMDGLIERNPRDGLITVMAYVVGEEHFDDNNGNGVYDLGEPFVDQGEPFVDSNDNNVWDPGEFIVPETVGGVDNGVWDPPNGVYDSKKIIWTEAKILATNHAEPGIGTLSGPTPMLCPSGVPKGGLVDFAAYLPDLNINRVYSGATLSLRRLGTRGTVAWYNTALLDGYGFQYDRLLVNAATPTLECAPTTPRCVWKSVFGSWGAGWVGTVRVTGVMVTDTTPCADELSLSAEASVQSTLVPTLPISFGIQ